MHLYMIHYTSASHSLWAVVADEESSQRQDSSEELQLLADMETTTHGDGLCRHHLQFINKKTDNDDVSACRYS